MDDDIINREFATGIGGTRLSKIDLRQVDDIHNFTSSAFLF
jgi:hypothetical protein